MKSFLFITLACFSLTSLADEGGRFKVDQTTKIIGFFGESAIGDRPSYASVEKEAWADAVQYLYRNFGGIAEYFDSEVDRKVLIPALVARLRSRNTTYFKDGKVRVKVEFSFEGYAKLPVDPFAASEKAQNRL